MQMTEHETATAVPVDRTDWFFEKVGQDPVPVDDLADALEKLYLEKKTDEADTLAELIQDALAGRDALRDAVDILHRRASIRKKDAGFKQVCENSVLKMVEGNREHRILTEHIGLDKEVPAHECMRRFLNLMDMAPDKLCTDKTWGFGIIQEVDAFYQRVTIDFAKKNGHEMSFAYAAEALDLISDDHLLARRHRDSDGLKLLITEDPAEIVRISLRSYGPMNVTVLQETLIRELIDASGWKKFWDAARKGLKADPFVEIPRKRSEAIRLREKAFAYDEEWFSSLMQVREIPAILQWITEWLSNHDLSTLTDEGRATFLNRLAFAAKGARGGNDGQVAKVLMLSKRLGITPGDLKLDGFLASSMTASRIKSIAGELPSRDLRTFLENLAETDSEQTETLLLNVLPDLPFDAIQDVVDVLSSWSREADAISVLRGILDAKNSTVDMMAWFGKNADGIASLEVASRQGFLNDILNALENGQSRSGQRSFNQVCALFEDSEWLAKVLQPARDEHRRAFMGRIKESSAFDEMDRRMILGRIIKLYPELESEMKAREDEDESAPPRVRATSHRSFRERQRQLKKLINEDIPKNSKEIALARSYGDLRENFEFKAAKEMQAVLLRREAELEAMLDAVTPADFSNFPHERAGVGTGVTLEYEDGRSETFFILGDWDRDEDLGIISSTTKMAEALLGKSAGEEVQVPAEEGKVPARISLVSPLTEEILAWCLVGADDE
jgi:transcription elongation GreA/GreB family factor